MRVVSAACLLVALGFLFGFAGPSTAYAAPGGSALMKCVYLPPPGMPFPEAGLRRMQETHQAMALGQQAPWRDRMPPSIGENRPIVLMADFSDKVGAKTEAEIDDMLFSVGTYPTGSMRDYYLECSQGQLNVSGTVKGWYRAPQTLVYYADGQEGMGTSPQNSQGLIEDMIALADPDVDFSEHDVDGDGFVDGVVVVYAGSRYDSDTIWPHAWSLFTPVLVDGVYVQDFNVQDEEGGIGVFCHEYGHTLGLPDLYDYDGSSDPLGTWCIMDAAGYNGDEEVPGHFSAWCKVALGWIEPFDVAVNVSGYVIRPAEDNPDIVRVAASEANPGEYFLVENRQQTGFDQYIVSSGVAIYHVDEQVLAIGYGVNDTEWMPGDDESVHLGVAMEQADGLWELEQNLASNPEDLFGSGDSLTDSTTPNSRGYNESVAISSVTGIGSSGSNYTLSIDVGRSGETFSVSGDITTSGLPLPSVTVAAGSATAITDADGHYAFAGVGQGSVEVIPSKEGYDFTPLSEIVNVTANVSGVDFEASLAPFDISGAITMANDALLGDPIPLPGVRVTAAGTTVVTDANGNYTIPDVDPDPGVYIVRPLLAGYVFTALPTNPSAEIAAGPPDVVGLDFEAAIATYEVTGAVTERENALAGVVIEAWPTGAYDPSAPDTGDTGDEVLPEPASEAITDDLGLYVLSGLEEGVYDIVAIHPLFDFEMGTASVPPDRVVNFDGTATAANTLDVTATIPDGTTDQTVTVAPGDEVTINVALQTVQDSPVMGDSVRFRGTGESVEVAHNLRATSDVDGLASVTVHASDYILGTTVITATSSTGEALTGTCSITVAYTVDIPAGAGPSQVKLFAPPVGGDPGTVLNADVAVARYSPEVEGGYEVYDGSNFSFLQWQAYWLQAAEDLQFTGVSGMLPFQGDGAITTVNLPLDWALMGNPTPRAADWNPSQVRVLRDGVDIGSIMDAAEQELIDPYAWTWLEDEERYALLYDPSMIPGAQDTVAAHGGFWIRTYVSGLALDVRAPFGTGPVVSAAETAPEGDWILELTGTTDLGTVAGCYVGASSSPLCRNGLRAAVPPSPSLPGSSVRLSVVDGDTTETIGALIRANEGSTMDFDVLLDPNGYSGGLAIEWGDLRQLPRHLTVALVDEQTGRRVNMRSASGYITEVSADAPRRLQVLVRQAGLGALRVVASPAQIVSRGAAFSATVNYTLTRDADVSGVVRNAAGRVVGTIPTAFATAGANTLSWDGRGEAGQTLPQGHYLVEIGAVADDGERTTALIPLMR